MNRELSYVTHEYTFEFARPALIDNYPTFVLRSVLGNELKRMHCAMRGELCERCPFNRNCAYSFIFESSIAKDTQSLPGRDRSSHPFRIWTEAVPGSITRKLIFYVQLYGRAIEYIPHVAYAFREAGIKGLFKARVQAKLSSILDDGQELLKENRIIIAKANVRRLVWDTSPEVQELRKASITCITPLRFKSEGRYRMDFDGQAFLQACRRRVFTMLEMFGEKDDGTAIGFSHAETDPYAGLSISRALRWVDFQHYSGRQDATMMLGGTMGTFNLEGSAPSASWNALDFCTIIGAGKNTSFGYGTIRVEYGPVPGGKANG